MIQGNGCQFLNQEHIYNRQFSLFELFRPPIATLLNKYFLTKLEKGIKKRKILCYFKSGKKLEKMLTQKSYQSTNFMILRKNVNYKFPSLFRYPFTIFQLFWNSIHCKENSIYVFLFWEWCDLSPDFHIHVSMSDLYIPRIGPHNSLQQNRHTYPGNI